MPYRSAGAQTVCDIQNPTTPCYFYSFGISTDYSFVTALADKTGCYGFAAGTTISHQALLSNKVTFHHLVSRNPSEASCTTPCNICLWFVNSPASQHDHFSITFAQGLMDEFWCVM
eukprot:GHRQ01034503.1.p1 GENE.GHRQ01034503.1~~GHRQ01034503.1.p1  ORF type:complete len:116 (+),score=6.37 GHRQ01034503.1:224-571(+)